MESGEGKKRPWWSNEKESCFFLINFSCNQWRFISLLQCSKASSRCSVAETLPTWTSCDSFWMVPNIFANNLNTISLPTSFWPERRKAVQTLSLTSVGFLKVYGSQKLASTPKFLQLQNGRTQGGKQKRQEREVAAQFWAYLKLDFALRWVLVLIQCLVISKFHTFDLIALTMPFLVFSSLWVCFLLFSVILYSKTIWTPYQGCRLFASLQCFINTI